MLGAKGGIGNLMKKAQEMQKNLQTAQEEIAKIRINGESGGGLVKVTMSGKHELIKVEIDASLMDDKEMLEDLVAAAVNDSAHKVEKYTKEKMGDISGSMNLPAGMNLPF